MELEAFLKVRFKLKSEGGIEVEQVMRSEMGECRRKWGSMHLTGRGKECSRYRTVSIQ